MSTLTLAAALAGTILAGCGGGTSASGGPTTEVTSAMVTSAREWDPRSQTNTDSEREDTESRFLSFLNQLRAVPQLAPLFDMYHLSNPIVLDDDAHSSGLIQLLRAVRISVDDGKVRITNRATGKVIFTASLSSLATGTFYPENLPGGGTPTTLTCTTFTYGAWGVCDPATSTQVRPVLTSSPTGCTGGSPATSQSCSPAAPTCTSFSYSAWGACDPATSRQTRTVVASSPTGCAGGTPALSQSCTPTAPTCTSFGYSAWGTCDPATSTQTRTVLSSSPTGCTGGSPVTTASCTPVAPTCTAFTYSAWGACDATTATQTRTVLSSTPTGCTGGAPLTRQSCTPPPVTCTSFTYSAWGTCNATTSTQTRTVLTSSPASCTGGTPVTSQACTPALDGAALYSQSCSGCHGALASSNLKGKNISVSLIQSMGMTQGLSTAQLQAIVTAVGP
jgi:hypothetical protein